MVAILFAAIFFLLCASSGCNLASGKGISSQLAKERAGIPRPKEQQQPLNKSVLKHAVNEGLNGGIAGLVQVLTMMWLRTTVNYQYRYGVGLFEALNQLYNQGGIPRFYKGLPYAMVQGPLCRFGSVASNEGAKKMMQRKYFAIMPTQTKIFLASFLGSLFSVLWRIFLMPLDTVKTILQVDGLPGFEKLIKRVMVDRDIKVLFRGSKATTLATFIGHSWFLMHNWLESMWPRAGSTSARFWRSAFIGFLSSAFSDSLSNSIRVIKTMRQAAIQSGVGDKRDLSYRSIARKLIKEQGYLALFGRGLLTRILSNGLQSILFTIAWQTIRRMKLSMRRAVKVINNLGLLETPDLDHSSLAGEVLATEAGVVVDIGNGNDVGDIREIDDMDDPSGGTYDGEYMNLDSFGTSIVADPMDVPPEIHESPPLN
jgi:hypothetical protein